MNISSRYFILVGDDVVKISQRTMWDFYFKRKAVLKEYAGQTLIFVDVIVSIEDRRPHQIIRTYCMRQKVSKQGAIDEKYDREFGSHMANKLNGKAKVIYSGSIVNASDFFKEKTLKNKYEGELNSKQLQKIIDILFKKIRT